MPRDAHDREPDIERFLGEPTRDLDDWARLWTADRPFPVRSHRRGLAGRLIVACKRLLRPFLKGPLGDLWDRQRTYNLILLEEVGRRFDVLDGLARHQRESERTFQGAIEDHARLLEQLDRRLAGSMTDVMRHNDALYARVDQKLDRYRREARELWHRLGAFLAAGEPLPERAAATLEEQEYFELERRFRGSEEEIAERVAVYLPQLEKAPGEVLDLGCGRGEALLVLERHGVAARGVDASGEMVERTRARGLRAERADLLEYLGGLEEASLGGVTSFHVIEHLPPAAVRRLVRLAWRALRPAGLLILETPSPTSVVMAARDFWIDPTHGRPVHPASLEVTLREAGFEPVHRLDLHPFPDKERLPEIDLSSLPEEQRALADGVNRLRDLLDDLLFGHRDFALIGVKPLADR